ncbi:YpjP family protein [Alkalicoccobacillus porphyridii]|uniref:YpjP-like protein n=1 Tax=Alkalicoccobacillus porphyridii TaxID=2597270 RepID=A0A553ZZV2_9BACI|nr:YpjP family protein [Alkalicoccobacillus porphyridii]TSB46977.1 hypothetical protein FN960_08125 [Alkalicoccobacillus porphyridii]
MIAWMKRLFLVASAILTLGLVDFEEPAQTLSLFTATKSSDEPKDNKSFVYKIDESDYALFHSVLPASVTQYVHYDDEQARLLAKSLAILAKEQGFHKFGEVISDRIGRDFERTVLTSLEPVLARLVTDLSVDQQRQIDVTEQPSSKKGEKILHVFSKETGEDMLRFHVRRDQPPKQGHWFNFHYHIASDNYEHHYPLATIYWGKDVPPSWSA